MPGMSHCWLSRLRPVLLKTIVGIIFINSVGSNLIGWDGGRAGPGVAAGGGRKGVGPKGVGRKGVGRG
jgi:hypothetical protein